MNFVKNKQNLNVFSVWGMIHRLIRDIKLAAEKACDGDLYRALLHFSFVASLNAKPFGSGAAYEKKKAARERFKDMEGAHGAKFRFYAELWALDKKGFTLIHDSDYEALFDELDELPSWSGKLSPIKVLRWFSANERWEETKEEFWPSKMIFSHSTETADTTQELHEPMDDPATARRMDPKKEMKASVHHHKYR